MNIYSPFYSFETLGVICGVTSVFLLARGNAIGFVVGLVNTIIYICLDLHKNIYGQMLVNAYYTVMNTWGLYGWTRKNEKKQSILQYSYLLHREKIFAATLFVLFFCLLFGVNNLLTRWGVSPAKTPVLDSFITSLIFVAMYLSTRKKIEGWYLWLSVNVIAIVLFYANGMYITIIQYAIYFIFALMGRSIWIKKYRQQHANSPN